MNLFQAIEKIVNLRDIKGEVIFAQKPWGISSNALIDFLDSNDGVPQHIRNAGYEYFLESEIIKELVDFKNEKKVDLDKFVELIIYYAEYDAYPDWANELSQ